MILFDFTFIPSGAVATRSELRERATSLSNISYENNREYIDRLLSKGCFDSAVESIFALEVLDGLLCEARSFLHADVRLLRDENGRPHISGAHGIDIGITHTELFSAAAISLGEGARVGIDAERIYKKSPLSLARRFFADAERELIERSDNASLAFTEIWTRKEAYLKYTGTGLSVPLSSFDVTGDDLPPMKTFGLGDVVVSICGE